MSDDEDEEDVLITSETASDRYGTPLYHMKVLMASDLDDLPAEFEWPEQQQIPTAEDARKSIESFEEFSLMCIAISHPCKSPIVDSAYKLMPLMLLVVQLVLPLCLWWGQYHATTTSCHKNGDMNRKIVMVLIGLFYFVRVSLLSLRKALVNTDGCFGMVNVEAVISDDFADNLRSGYWMINPFSSFSFAVFFDTFMQGPYEYLLYIFNLYIVFHGSSALDMVLNAVAIEFVMRMGDEYKTMYMSVNGCCAANMVNIAKSHSQPEEQSLTKAKVITVFYLLVQVLTMITVALAYFSIFAAMTFGAVCKE